MQFVRFVINAGWWSIQNGALWSFFVLFILVLLVSYLVSSIAALSLVPSWRRLALVTTISASLALVVVSWGFLDNYVFHLEAARHGCEVVGPYKLQCQAPPQLP